MGTIVLVTKSYESNFNNAVDLTEETWLSTTVQNIGKNSDEKARVGITGDIFFRRYFRIKE